MLRMAPSNEYLLLEDQPAMNTAIVFTEPMAMTNSTPTLRSARTIPSPKGRTAKTTRAGMNMTMGAVQKRSLSACRLVMASLDRSLRASATGCRSPQGPTRLGPRRAWMRPMRRRSIQMKASWLRSIQIRIATTPMRPETT